MKLKIKKGLNLRLQGEVALPSESTVIPVRRIAISPDDFEGFIPKTEVKAGDTVAVGQPIMHHKSDVRIKLVSPVAGVVTAVERGERRHIERIVIEKRDTPGDDNAFRLDTADCDSPEKLTEILAQAGLLAFIRRRPYADVPKTDIRPRDIFVSAFDSAPLAVDRQWNDSDTEPLKKGFEVLAAITTGKVYVSRRKDGRFPRFDNIADVEVSGPHPAGLPGVQAANISPVNKGETVWTLSADTVRRIGVLFLSGRFDSETLVTVCGSRIDRPYVARTVIGAEIEPLLAGRIDNKGKHKRIISGNVLTGIKIADGDRYLHFPYTQITVIPEGDDVDEFMGWASLSPSKMSVSPSFPGLLFRKRFNPDARINGGRRAMIMSGEYDRVLPMNIYAEYLLKAIKSRDISNMEKLGIYEVAPEDFALAECIDSSKQPLQQIVREGLDFLRKELE